MSASAVSAERRAAKTKAKRLDRERRNKLARAEAARIQEERDEAIAPAAQRAKRLARDGNTFRVASAIVTLWKQGQRREKNGGEPTINGQHVKAADRLQRSWEISRTVTFGVSNYTGAGGHGESGALSMAALASVRRQHEALAEVNGVIARLGPLWPVVEDVALKGVSVADWSEKRAMEQRAAYGYLRAGLDLLVNCYARAAE